MKIITSILTGIGLNLISTIAFAQKDSVVTITIKRQSSSKSNSSIPQKSTSANTEIRKISGRMSNSQYQQDTKQFENIKNILSLNVVEFYNLKDKYDTELKQKIYKSTEDYNDKLLSLQKQKSILLASNYILDFEPEYYERNNLIKYNLTTKAFTVTYRIYSSDKYNKPGKIQFNNIVFTCPQNIFVKQRTFVSGDVDFIEQAISFKIMDETIAQIIEENRSQLIMRFEFKFTQAVPFQNNLLGLGTYVDYHLQTKIQKVIIYNNSTNEIYAEYEPTTSENMDNKRK